MEENQFTCGTCGAYVDEKDTLCDACRIKDYTINVDFLCIRSYYIEARTPEEAPGILRTKDSLGDWISWDDDHFSYSDQGVTSILDEDGVECFSESNENLWKDQHDNLF